jgi:signal transduction histidine kinase
VTSREEERRRLRRDLHDGIGPALAALHLQAGVLRRLIRDDPETAESLVDEFKGDIRAAIDEIRRVVYALRPPVLDELGLVAAVRACAAQYSRGGGGLQVQVQASDEMPTLPAAVEVAAYRIVQEALANVAQHAQARQCQVCLVLNHELRLEIVDDGVGLLVEGQRGLGILSMQERAAELGGRCVVMTAVPHGTRVTATLPLPGGEES